jgi:adenylyl-sulfate kinase
MPFGERYLMRLLEAGSLVYIRCFAHEKVEAIELTNFQSFGEDMGQKGFTLWFTGLSGAGKTTLARLVEDELLARGHRVEVLDGDVIRTNLSKGLGFSKEDRDTNIRRIGFVCHLLTRNDVVAIAAAISPYREVRNEVRQLIGAFVEVYCKCPIGVLAERDVKGLYKKALAGEIKNFTGVDDPYEEPVAAEIVVETHRETPGESASRIVSRLEELGLVSASESVYAESSLTS